MTDCETDSQLFGISVNQRMQKSGSDRRKSVPHKLAKVNQSDEIQASMQTSEFHKMDEEVDTLDNSESLSPDIGLHGRLTGLFIYSFFFTLEVELPMYIVR